MNEKGIKKLRDEGGIDVNKRLKAKLEKRQALFKSQTDHRAIGKTIRLATSRQGAQSNTHRLTTRDYSKEVLS